ncbi:MAG: metal-sensing transcriptional repressor [Lachnospiraceae bacterium]|nr:metal-sensing transcriptional repressor [Lachnospiraceae bacterium]
MAHTHEHEHEHPHDHAASHDHTHDHSHDRGPDHDHSHNHSHTHDPKEIRRIVNRLSRSIGHLESVKRMVEDGKDCSDVLVQLAAVRAELNSTGKQLLKEHMEHCIVEAMEEQDTEALEKLNQAIDQFMK